MRVLTRYILREWLKVVGVTALGFPVIVIAVDLTDNLSRYLARGLSRGTVLLSYAYEIPETMFMVLPAAVLFATVFTLVGMGRHSELIAANASGISFYRLFAPLVAASVLAAGLGVALVEVAPIAARRAAELRGERERRENERVNFVYRADAGWVYTVASLDIRSNAMAGVLFERRGTGEDYPTIAIQAARGTYDPNVGHWTLADGTLRYLRGAFDESVFTFDSLLPAMVRETPEALLAEPKDPEEMRYAELADYIEALERSGGDAKKLKVEHALKLAVPATCIIITLFGAPLAITSPRQGMAWGVAVGLGTTVVFLLLIQLSEAIGSGGAMPPIVAAWAPNALFGLAGLVLLTRVRT